MIRFSRRFHKWLMAFVGLQFLIWTVTGLYMVSMDIHFIHGESLVADKTDTIDMDEVRYPLSALIRQYPDAYDISLVSPLGKPEYQFRYGNNTRIRIDAGSGNRLSSVNEAQARELARNAFTGESEIAHVSLITDTQHAPTEISPRVLPVWQVTFERYDAPTLYISEQTGQIVTRRHNFWRLFDWMWRFHIMDYDDGENVANAFLLLIALTGLLATLLGAVLTYNRFAPAVKYRRQK